LAAGEHRYRLEPRSAAVLVAGPAPDHA